MGIKRKAGDMAKPLCETNTTLCDASLGEHISATHQDRWKKGSEQTQFNARTAGKLLSLFIAQCQINQPRKACAKLDWLTCQVTS